MHSLAARMMVVLGLALLAGSAARPWLEVPSGFTTRADGRLACVTRQPRASAPFRAGSAALAAAMALAHLRSRRTGPIKAMAAASALAVLMAFPCAAMTWEPATAGPANWLYAQHDNLTWSGGDMPTGLESSRKWWKDRIYLVEAPRQVNAVRMPSSGLGALQLGRLEVWVETLGYSNCFAQFARSGWYAALAGAALLAMGQCLPGGRPSRRRLGLATAAWSATALACLVGSLVPVMVASRGLEKARRATARGDYDEAAGRLREVIRLLPTLGEDTSCLAQLGLLDHRLGHYRTPEGQLFLANLLERQGRYAQALAIDQALVAGSPPGSAIRREAGRAILRRGISAFNAGRNDEAIRLLGAVLDDEPCNLKANYAMQLACLKAGRREDVARLARQIEATYAHFQAPTKAIVLSQSRENEMFAALKEADMGATMRHAVEAKK